MNPGEAKEIPKPRIDYTRFMCLCNSGMKFEIDADCWKSAVEVARLRCNEIGEMGFTVYQS